MTHPLIPLPHEIGFEFLRSEVGSTLHGTGLPGGEDRDEMGIYIEWPGSTVGLGSHPHWTFRTAGEGQRSGPGDLDLTCYSLRKWARLAIKGNPSVLLPLFAPDDRLVVSTGLATQLRSNANWFVSRKAGEAFLGYMRQQRARMTGERGKAGRVRSNPEGGIDWKYAMHMLRLGLQGVEFLLVGAISLPIPEHDAELLRLVRKGEVPFNEVILYASSLERRLEELVMSSPHPERPNVDAVERWVIEAHLSTWRATGVER